MFKCPVPGSRQATDRFNQIFDSATIETLYDFLVRVRFGGVVHHQYLKVRICLFDQTCNTPLKTRGPFVCTHNGSYAWQTIGGCFVTVARACGLRVLMPSLLQVL